MIHFPIEAAATILHHTQKDLSQLASSEEDGIVDGKSFDGIAIQLKSENDITAFFMPYKELCTLFFGNLPPNDSSQSDKYKKLIELSMKPVALKELLYPSPPSSDFKKQESYLAMLDKIDDVILALTTFSPQTEEQKENQANMLWRLAISAESFANSHLKFCAYNELRLQTKEFLKKDDLAQKQNTNLSKAYFHQMKGTNLRDKKIDTVLNKQVEWAEDQMKGKTAKPDWLEDWAEESIDNSEEINFHFNKAQSLTQGLFSIIFP